MSEREYLVSAPRGLTDLLLRELQVLGALEARESAQGVRCRGDLSLAYRISLESRIASRVFLLLQRATAADTESFYRAARSIDWALHLAPGATLACEFSGRHPTIVNSQFGALRLKDAICDQLRETAGWRPDIARERPSVRVHAHANGPALEWSLDLSGEGLHRRGYRLAGGPAPLRENLAAGMLMRSGWPQIAASGGLFLDPMCGSGTLVIEAALIAADVPPNLWREYFGFLGWRQHDAALWRELLAAARERAQAGVARMQSHVVGGGAAAGGVRFFGSDRDPEAIRAARANAERAGVAGWTQFALADVAACQVPSVGMGLVAVNPPYGERLEDRERARELHRLLGKTLQSRFMGWQAAVLTGAPDLGLELGLRAERTHKLWNGPLECRLLRFDLQPEAVRDLRPNARAEVDTALAATNGAQMFGNRLTKNIKRLKSWVQRADVSCYRLYDADMPEYAFAIDRYAAANGERTWLYVQEYAAPEEIPRDEVRRRRGEVLATLPLVTGVAPEDIHLRVRRRMSGSAQYEKSAASGEFHVVAESGLKFAVNFRDYLDTGLFLDHRLTRQRIRALAAGKRFLNLFAYTGTATVYAAAGGAVSTVSVDLSHTYIDWARRNLKLNALDSPRNTYDHADCREWLKSVTGEFDLIFLDPPTFSNSARMQGTLAVERDHAELIAGCIRLLAPEGLLLFSTNAQRFKLDGAIEKSYAITDISRATLPEDFARNPRIHRCFEIRR